MSDPSQPPTYDDSNSDVLYHMWEAKVDAAQKLHEAFQTQADGLPAVVDYARVRRTFGSADYSAQISCHAKMHDIQDAHINMVLKMQGARALLNDPDMPPIEHSLDENRRLTWRIWNGIFTSVKDDIERHEPTFAGLVDIVTASTMSECAQCATHIKNERSSLQVLGELYSIPPLFGPTTAHPLSPPADPHSTQRGSSLGSSSREASPGRSPHLPQPDESSDGASSYYNASPSPDLSQRHRNHSERDVSIAQDMVAEMLRLVTECRNRGSGAETGPSSNDRDTIRITLSPSDSRTLPLERGFPTDQRDADWP